ncbi:hypothetical protein NEDG_01008 [Nematocida displodere]|uniref:Protein YIF1 n=1 Tax=Nematocida displodere TaxID=1805483 RepID=A0A177ECZ8_9MICR|nr:hypothetical protein NEDG_01008 [Nematocida displodere]
MNYSLGMGLQKEAFNLGSSYVNKAISGRKLDKIRRYFQIDNFYLLLKIFLILFPFSSGLWVQSTNRDVPSVPVGHPDLYIPLMSVITYILFLAGEMEIKNKFEPEKLGKMATRIFMVDILEMFVIKGASFFFESQDVEILEILGFIGYKYVPILVMKVAGALVGVVLKKIISICLFFSFVVFLGKCLKGFLISGDSVMSVKKKRMYFLFLVVIIEGLVFIGLK